jgi:hypothetical protein
MVASGQTAEFSLARHASGDYGEVNDEDRQLNDEALIHGDRILSAYRTLKGVKLWVITEASDDNGHRAATTILRELNDPQGTGMNQDTGQIFGRDVA